MLRNRGCLLTVIGVTLALLTGGLVYYLLQQAAPPEVVVVPTPTPVPSRPVPAAARELTAGTTISTTDLVTREYPANLVPVGVLTDTSQIVGQTIVEPILQGEHFRPGQVGPGGEVAVSLAIDPDRVAMAFTREDLLNKSQVIREGDRIDLLLTLDIQEETATETRQGKSTSYTVQNIRVLRIIRPSATQENPNPEPTSILFEMDPQDAVIAKFVKDSGGIMDFTLRSPSNVEELPAEMINNDFLFDNYGFRAPISSTRPKEQ